MEPTKMKTALVYGAGGFIGSHLAKRLKDEGYWVRGVDIKEPEYMNKDDIADHFVIRDLRIPVSVTETIGYAGCKRNPYQTYAKEFDRPFDEIYQLAADMGGAGYVFTGDNDANIMHNSATINLNLLDQLVTQHARLNAPFPKVFYSSSACIYPQIHKGLEGTNTVQDCRESKAYPANPDSEYGWEKLFSERLYAAYARNHDVPVRIARFHNIYGPCFDDQTEVLTKTGWKYFKDVTLLDDIASLNENGELEYQQPKAKQEYRYSGEMYKVKGKSIDQLVTPDHKLYISSLTTIDGLTKKTEFSLKEAKSIKWNTNKLFFTSFFKWKGHLKNDKYVIPECKTKDGRKLWKEKTINIDDWFEFIGWYVSEGSRFITPSNHIVCISQYESCNSKNRTEIKNLLNRMDIHYSEDVAKTQIIITSKQIYYALENEGIGIGSRNKNIPCWMLQYPTKQLQILFDALMKGDGHKSGKRYTTKSKKLADQFMEISIKLGKTATLNASEHINIISLSNRKMFCSKRNTRSKIIYDGMVYDVTLPKYHVLLTRRNGKICWSGNCGTWKGGKEKAPAAICRKVIQADSEIEIWGNGSQTRSFLYISDCIDAVRMMMKSSHQGPLNIGSEEMVSINELVNIAEKIENKNLKRVYVPGPVGVPGRNSHNAMIESCLGWKPKVFLEEGINLTYYWIKGQINNE